MLRFDALKIPQNSGLAPSSCPPASSVKPSPSFQLGRVYRQEFVRETSVPRNHSNIFRWTLRVAP